MKILVIGFPRSGTTMMQRIIRQHPNVKKMFFETNLMKLIGTEKENLLNKKFPQGKNIGEKVIYEKEVMGKANKDAPTPIDYCKLWNKRFKNEAIIIQIIRHPYDVWNSLLIKKYVRRDIKYAIVKMERKYFEVVPKYFTEVARFRNCLTVKYEDVVANPEIVIPEIYSHCKLDSSFKSRERMRAGRLFAYKRNGFFIHQSRLKNEKNQFLKVMNENIEECLRMLNKFPGPEYEI